MRAEPRVLLWMPLPPPFAGPEVASELLANATRVHLPSVRVENASLRANNMRKGRLDWSGVAAFAKAYRRFFRGARNADVVYLVAAANTVGCVRDAVLIATARLMGRRIVIHLRGGRYREYFAGSNALMKRLLRFSWGSASRAIVQVPRLSHVFDEAAPHVEVVVLPNGLRADQFPSKRSYATRSPRILFVGHLTYPKGFYDLLQAFNIVRRTWPDATLACAGELPHPQRNFADFLPIDKQAGYLRRRHELCADIRELVTKGDGIEYAGVVNGVAKTELFLSADVFVLPSYTEGFSLALLEAMFHGLPIITTRVGGSPDIVKDGENGLLVEPGDVTGLVRSIERLIENQTLRERMGRTNARIARELYDLGIVAERFAEILTSTRASHR